MYSIGIAYVLWFFLGVFGVHRFYLGRTGSGLLWLLTGGLCGVGQLVDLFLIPSLVDEANRRAGQGGGAPVPAGGRPRLPNEDE
jgi:TM2 domain-containing membrane protein YozV